MQWAFFGHLVSSARSGNRRSVILQDIIAEDGWRLAYIVGHDRRPGIDRKQLFFVPAAPTIPDPATAGARIAAIDVGSNSIRLVVAEVLTSGGYRVLDEERENTRMAAALVATGRLNPKAADASVTVLRNFLSIAKGYGVSQVRAIGTSALRDAEDGPEFCDRVRKELKLSIEVISANEEARLAFLSVARAFDISGRKVAVADIGGGSMEIVLASSGLVDQVYETKLGAVRVTEACGVTGRSSEKRLVEMREFIDGKLKKEIGKPPFAPDMLFGTGGTFTALASIIMARRGMAEQPMWGYRVSRAEIRHLVADLAAMSLERRCKVIGLSPQRADIIVAGLVVIERVMRKLGANVVQVHTRGVRDGLMLTMIGGGLASAVGYGTPSQSATNAEDRRAAVEEFAKNCGVDLPHARQVAKIAGSLWRQLAGPLNLKPEDRELLEAAATIANVGYLINFDGHHKHSYHLIRNAELSGFERRQVQILANVARYHRGTRPKKRHENFSQLSLEDRHRVSALAAILRLAFSLDRTHQQHVDEVRTRVQDDVVRIFVKAQADPNVDLWAAERKVDLFERVFGRKVRFSARDTSRRRVTKRRVRSTGTTKRRRTGGGES
jgi:exopolyphosphatase/guanosine-5'-triphosphate,3'-diphosphate pyrophosphatase